MSMETSGGPTGKVNFDDNRNPVEIIRDHFETSKDGMLKEWVEAMPILFAAYDQALIMGKVVGTARALDKRMDEIHDDPKYIGVWGISQAHVGEYDGPNYVTEHENLKAALAHYDAKKGTA